jgi:hypothetical protein
VIIVCENASTEASVKDSVKHAKILFCCHAREDVADSFFDLGKSNCDESVKTLITYE